MDDKNPSTEHPVSSHPNAVLSAPEEPEEQPLTPKAYESLPPDYHKSKSKKGRYVIIAAAILLLAAAVYLFLLKPKPAKAPTSSSSSSSQNPQSSQAKTEKEHYDSSNFNLGFDYPKGWTVKDSIEELRVVSGVVKLKDTAGKQIDGLIEMTITTNKQKLYGLDKNASTAVLSSEKIAYTKPSETQRGNTYISFLNYPISTSKGLDAIYVTGDNGYQKDQDIPRTDIEKSDPVISVVFTKCAAGCAEGGNPVTIDTSMWESSSFSTPIKTMLQSLSIQ